MTARRSTLDRARDDLTAAVKRRERDKARADRTATDAKAAKDTLADTDREVEALRGYVGALEPGAEHEDATGEPMTAVDGDTVTGDGRGHALPDAS